MLQSPKLVPSAENPNHSPKSPLCAVFTAVSFLGPLAQSKVALFCSHSLSIYFSSYFVHNVGQNLVPLCFAELTFKGWMTNIWSPILKAQKF